MAITSFKITAQTAQDSLSYHYRHLLNPEDGNDIPNAIRFYSELKARYLKERKIYNAIEALRLIAIGHYKMGNSYDSESAAVEALRLIDRSQKSDTLIESKKGLYNQLGKTYRATLNFNKALEAYGNALKYSKTQTDSITILNNTANIHKDLKQYDKALEHLKIALEKKDVRKNKLLYAMVLDNLGYVQSKLKIPAALSNLEESLQLREEQNDLSGIYSSAKNLTLYHLDNDEKERAVAYAEKAYRTATLLNSLSYLQDALSLFAMLDEDPKIVRFKHLTDSLAAEKQRAENKNAFIKYNVEKERQNTAKAELQEQQERNQKVLYMALGIFATVLAFFIIIILSLRHKKEKIRQVYNTEARISKKVHDEVANEVYRLMARVQSNKVSEELLLDNLEDIYNKTRDISKENSAIAIGNNFAEQLNELLLSYQTPSLNIVTRNLDKIDWAGISSLKKTAIYRLIQELMTNMKKHSQASTVVLLFLQKNKKLTIEYADNGVGCTLKNKNGLHNAENRIRAINGSITFDTEPGKGFKSKINI